jgi:hypothetical protein
LAGFKYRKKHIINAATGAGTLYQVKVTVHYASGVDSAGDVYLGGKCRTDFGDVRWCSSDGRTQLDYWIESKTDGDNAVFWVEVADDLSTNPATIYIYYGKADATTTSNGDNTFLFFDDFNVDLSKWTVVSGTWTISNGELVSATTDDDQIRSADTYGNFADIRIRSKYRNIQNDVFYLCMARWSGSGDFYGYQAETNVGATEYWMDMWKRVGGSWTELGTHAVVSDSGNHIMEFLLSGSSLKGLRDGVQTHSVTDTTFTSGKVGIRRGDTATTPFYVDWFFVSKYVDPEPTHGSWGRLERRTRVINVKGRGGEAISKLSA